MLALELSRPGANGVHPEVATKIRTELYEERETPGAGIAAFAKAFIPSGTRIFCEEALIVVRDEARQPEVYKAVNSLPKDKQAAYWELAASSKPTKDVDWINQLRSSYDGEPDSFNAIVESHEQAWSIYETNRFSLRYPNGDYKLGIFPRSARLNHACAPNVFHRYNPRINRLTIHALKDIQPGEELNTSYIDICHPTVVRRQMLKGWGFRCQCVVCESPDDEQDYRRKQLEDIMKKVKKRESQRQLSGSNWPHKEYERSMKLIQKGVRLMNKEQMEESDTLGFLLTLATRYGLLMGQAEAAALWAASVVAIEEKCLGEDSNEHHAALVLRKTAEAGGLASRTLLSSSILT
ncbi:hypothetical protein JX266_011699 [Neoarthrinium moseri]|nr:hypothetical protein JX266_011699 [Neoarthrinium moseri]